MAVIAGSAACGVADRHGDTDHMRDGVVVAVDGDEAPGAEHASIDKSADRVTRLPVFGLFECQRGGAALVLAHLEGAENANSDNRQRGRPQQQIAGLHGRHDRGHRGRERSYQHGPEILAHGIDQRRVKYGLQLFLTASLFLVDQLHWQRTRPVWRVALPLAGEVFLRERRYRVVAFFLS